MRHYGRLNLTGLLALVISVLVSAPAALAGEHAPINVATYNLRLNTPVDGPNVWALRREAVKALIRYHEFDLFGTQQA